MWGGGNLIAKRTQNIYYHYLGRAWKASAGGKGGVERASVRCQWFAVAGMSLTKVFFRLHSDFPLVTPITEPSRKVR